MSVYVIRDPILTNFNSLSIMFTAFGCNIQLRLNQDSTNLFKVLQTLADTSLQNVVTDYIRLLIEIPDPTSGALNSQNLDEMNNIFSNAPYSSDGNNVEGSPSTASNLFRLLVTLKSKIIPVVIPPPSWLDADGFLSDEILAIPGYANLLVSCYKWLLSYQLVVPMIELFPNPDSMSGSQFGSMYPKHLVTLANRFLDVCTVRKIEKVPKTLAPGLEFVLPLNVDQELWTESFVYSQNSLGCWDIQGYENEKDIPFINDSSKVSRTYLRNRLSKFVAQTNAVKAFIPRLVTSFGTIATKYVQSNYSLDTTGYQTNDEGDGKATVSFSPAAESLEYAVRVVENFCNILSNGFSTVMYGPLCDPDDEKSLFSTTGDATKTYSVFQFLLSRIPRPIQIFASEEMNDVGDETVKTLLISGDRRKFYFILCRPVLPDKLAGKMRLNINSPLFNSTTYTVGNLKIESFPDAAQPVTITTIDALGKTTTTTTLGPGVDLTRINTRATVNNGFVSLFLNHLPYGGCILLVSGEVSLKPPNPVPNPIPIPVDPSSDPVTPTKNPVVLQTIIQLPVNYGLPTWKDYDDDTVFYDSSKNQVMVWNKANAVWNIATFLPYV